ELDERQEEAAVEPVLVEVFGRAVRGRHPREAAREEHAEKPGEDHRIGDVADREFVETEELRFPGDRRGYRRDRLARSFRAGTVNAVVDLAHEGVEMDAPLGARG